MIRYLLLRVIPFLLVLLFARSLFRSIVKAFQVASRPNTPSPPDRMPATELKKDPVCGTYVAAETSLTRTVNGTVLHFCSAECRDKYRVA